MLPPRPSLTSPLNSQVALSDRRRQLSALQAASAGRADALARRQAEVGAHLRSDLLALEAQGNKLDVLPPAGWLDGLVRRFSTRRAALARSSATAELVTRYELASAHLRRASAWTDDLRLAALELQDDVNVLHREREQAAADSEALAGRVAEMEAALATLLGSDRPDRDRHADTLRFEIRQDTATLALLAQAEQMIGEHLGPARAVRDAVQDLYEQMSAWVLHATGLLDAAGRRVRALGAAADAPAVVADLQASLRDLHEAMHAAEDRLAASRQAVARAIPDLHAQAAAHAEVRALTGDDP